MQYRAIKDEIKDIEKRIEETKKVEIIECGVVKGSSKHFPYTPQNYHVYGIDPVDASKKQKEISELLRQREYKRSELIAKEIELEEYIADIQDSTTRLIFRKHFIDGDNQIKIGKDLGYDQSVISRKIRACINLHKKHRLMC
jgi:hypothetical protein